MNNLWTTYDLTAERCLHVRLDRLDLWIWRASGEWRLARQMAATPRFAAAVATVPPPEGLTWVRYAGADELPTLRLLPALPATPVMVRPADAIHLLPGHDTPFFVGIPLSVRVAALSPSRSLTLADFPVQALSKTWSGAPDDDEGVACQALRSRARRQVSELDPGERGRAICVLHVLNDTSDSFEFQRICLLCPHLGVLQGGDGLLWTTPVNVLFRGHASAARIRYDRNPPPAAPDATLLTPPREAVAESLSSRVFGAWRHVH